MVLQDPKVSTTTKFFARMFLDANLFAVKVKLKVTVGGRPSGTLATIIPIAKATLALNGKEIKPRLKNIIPMEMAAIERNLNVIKS